jgi:L-methionine (R)-S-oxide reductase
VADSIAFSRSAGREQIYAEITSQIESLIEGEHDLIANLANITAVLKEALGFFWVGFYLKKENQLVLGPFQGPLACTRIDFDRGVCGYSFTTGETVIVPNVDEFPGHIACSSAAKSEIVVPIQLSNGSIFGVLDVDSDKLDDFGDVDRHGLEAVIKVVERFIQSHTNSERNE